MFFVMNKRLCLLFSDGMEVDAAGAAEAGQFEDADVDHWWVLFSQRAFFLRVGRSDIKSDQFYKIVMIFEGNYVLNSVTDIYFFVSWSF